MSSSIADRLIEQIDVAGKLLRCVFHLYLQLLDLCLGLPFGKSGSDRLKIDGGIVGPDHREGMSDGGDNGIAVVAP